MLPADITTGEALAHLSRQDASDAVTLDRRRFLQLVGMGAGAGVLAGSGTSFLDELFLPGARPTAWAAGPVGPTDGILVVIGMHGGNDGLNTVVPIADGRYYDMHGGLAIPAAQTLAIDAEVGLHPRLTELKRFWDAGQLAIVDGIGYPNPDLSHFNSMAYWMAGRPHSLPTTGWLGRWLDGHLAGTRDLYAAAEVGWSLPLHLVGATQSGTVVPASRPGYGAATDERSLRHYDTIRRMRTDANGAWFRDVSQAFVDQLDLARTLAPVIPEEDALSDVGIVASLEVAARLINADLGFRILSAGFGDFDSHAGQPEMHAARMGELDAALARFFAVLDPAWRSRVAVMTYSEFGRTPWGNDGRGTDHGTAAPHFVIGQNVRGGRYGRRPSLAGLGQWDRMAHHVDFRSYYASLIDGWLGGGSSTVLGGSFENLGLFRAGPGAGGTPAPAPVVSAGSRLTPIAPARVADTRSGIGGLPTRPLGPNGRIRVKVAGVGGVPKSGVTAVVANVTAVQATTRTYFTVYPGSTTRPATSNLNAVPDRSVPNLVVMAVGSDGCIDVYNANGTAHCVVDVFGYFSTSAGDRFTAVQPGRLFDTRSGQGVRAGKLVDGRPLEIQVAGRAGVPKSGATAVVMNLTATEAESHGYLRVRPAGEASGNTSNVNFAAGDTVPNLVLCKLGTGGKVVLESAGRGTHALADVFGYFGAGDALRTVAPARVLDTREGIGATVAPVGGGRVLKLTVAGRASVPASATAVILNLTATNVTGRSYVSVWPFGGDAPGTSNLNVVPGRAIANLVVCRLGADGALSIANPRASCDVIADVLGYFVA